MKRWILIFSLIILFSSQLVWAGFDKRIIYPSERFRDVRKPKTRDEILWVNQWLVNVDNGVNKEEACLIAQKELVLRENDRDFDVTKPKVVAETDKEWQVRFPARYSFSRNRVPADFLACIDKKTGKVTCFKKRL